MTHKIKSTIKKIKDLDFSKEIIINELTAKKEVVARHYSTYKKAWPTLSEKDLWDKINETVLKDNIFDKAVKIALQSYEVNIDEQDIEAISKNFTKKFPTFANSPEIVIKNTIKQTLTKDLLLNDLARYWNIQATDQEAKMTFERMYVASEGLKSVHDYINDQATMNKVKGLIIRDKTANKLISQLKYTVDWKSIQKKNEEFNAKLKAKQEKK